MFKEVDKSGGRRCLPACLAAVRPALPHQPPVGAHLANGQSSCLSTLVSSLSARRSAISFSTCGVVGKKGGAVGKRVGGVGKGRRW
eukprot:65229-Chlamydomonas_euryale.AAC.3